MEDEIEGVVPEEVSVTAVTEAKAVETPVEEEPKESEKKFSQEELDSILQKRLAREQRKWDRERAVPTQNVSSAAEPDLKLTDFASPEEYADALADRKAEQKLAAKEQQRHASEIEDAFLDREEKAREKYDDFEQVAYNKRLPISSLMADTIKAADNGPDVLYFLGQNPAEAKRIFDLPAYKQPYEIGKIEAKLASSPPAKKTTSAPAPITPVTAHSKGSPSYDTTDPRSIKTMSDSEWIEADRARERKRLESRTR